MSMPIMARAIALAEGYAKSLQEGERALYREQLDKLVGFNERGVRRYPRSVASAMGRPDLGPMSADGEHDERPRTVFTARGVALLCRATESRYLFLKSTKDQDLDFAAARDLEAQGYFVRVFGGEVRRPDRDVRSVAYKLTPQGLEVARIASAS